MKELTRAEEQIMHVLWEIEKGLVKDILDRLPDPKPAYNTVSTIVRILEKKGFVDHEAFGKTHQYFPRITLNEYRRGFLKSLVNRFFGNSYQEMVSFFASDRKITIQELEEMKFSLAEEIERQKTEGQDGRTID
ncbi:MAG: BlaI/MecI/CopY family transcriptional regulator [Acidobacteria bacterium]|nr:BlaI/MecI/CopY family transcriptional regulator [Acidobacteriota bacterium]MBU4306616.1 BlaI/MecI/CopY family transcriptional regulator [Acidobacteriota bacterium]MCG2810280.1 BlaI/MecI/CopY family transcriptional regulator [Candidatus Aminicenantes bacterium]